MYAKSIRTCIAVIEKLTDNRNERKLCICVLRIIYRYWMKNY